MLRWARTIVVSVACLLPCSIEAAQTYICDDYVITEEPEKFSGCKIVGSDIEPPKKTAQQRLENYITHMGLPYIYYNNEAGLLTIDSVIAVLNNFHARLTGGIEGCSLEQKRGILTGTRCRQLFSLATPENREMIELAWRQLIGDHGTWRPITREELAERRGGRKIVELAEMIKHSSPVAALLLSKKDPHPLEIYISIMELLDSLEEARNRP